MRPATGVAGTGSSGLTVFEELAGGNLALRRGFCRRPQSCLSVPHPQEKAILLKNYLNLCRIFTRIR
jgi:hypothetical protein